MTMRISQLAERSGVPATTLRFYESAGLLTADRTPSGYRTYGEDAVTRLAFIASAKHLGLPLEEIGALLAVWETGACADVKADLRPRVAARLAEAEHRHAELAALTRSLHDVLHHLDTLPDRTAPCGTACGFPTGPPETGDPTPTNPPGTAGRCDTEREASAEPSDVGEPVTTSTSGGCAGEECESGAGGAGETVIACSLTGPGMAERVAEWRAVVEGARPVGIDGGVRVTLPVGKVAAVAELAAAEQRCCPFFDFRLLFAGAAVQLEVRAPADAAGLVNELFAP